MRRSLGHLVLASLALLLTGCGLLGPKDPPVVASGSSSPGPALTSGNISLPPVALPSGISSDASTSASAAPAPTATTAAPAGDVRTVADVAAFATPSGRIVCLLADGSARCDFVSEDKAWTAPRPASCELAWGSSLFVTRTAGSTCAGDTVVDTASADSDYVGWRKPSDPTVSVFDLTLVALPYGSSIVVGTLRCDSATTGVTCKNTATGHGFTMSREAYSIF